ncbi:MAG: T9SS type A sorting domain-containing protein [Rhodothermaceae bacterium]|nr:T9SS type A sorting domain-containing protein [Rhodothermaceae bacterium]
MFRALALCALALLLSSTSYAQVPGTSDVGDQFGRAVAHGDFNNDGFGDIAVGAPFEDVGTIAEAGAVTILYGSDGGIQASAAQVWTQESPGVLGDSRADDWFGYALASGDFDGDTYEDLAIGIRKATVNGLAEAGAVSVLYGSADGLTADGNQLWDQDSPDIGGGAEAGDEFGFAVAAGDFDRDGHDDLVIGVPGEAIGSTANAGAVQVIYGSPDGLTAAGNQFWDQGNDSVPGAAEAGDRFGWALAVGDFDGDTTDDLAIGTPFENIGSTVDAGAVYVLFGQVTVGLTGEGAQDWNQGDLSSSPFPETDDRFGYALAAGNLNLDAFDDLVVSAAYEDWTVNGETRVDNGIVHFIFGAAGGLNATGDQFWVLFGEDGRFGTSLAVGNPRGATPFVVAGSPGALVGGAGGAGTSLVFYTDEGGIDAANVVQFNQNTSGIEGGAEAEDAFGFFVAAGDFNGDGNDDLAAGVPGEAIGTTEDAGAVNVLYALSTGRISASNDILLYQEGPLATPNEVDVPTLANVLAPAAPNPTAGHAMVRYALAAQQDVRLAVYDVLGREVAALAAGTQSAGDHAVAFDATGLPSGVYVLHLTLGAETHTQRLTVAR